MAKTLFAADAALDSLLASSSSTSISPAKTSTPTQASIEKKAQKYDTEPQQERQQLNVDVDATVFAAVNLRKMRSKLDGRKDEDSFCKIVNLALRSHLKHEIKLVSTMIQD